LDPATGTLSSPAGVLISIEKIAGSEVTKLAEQEDLLMASSSIIQSFICVAGALPSRRWWGKT
jgi:hypothetical protein